MSSWSIAKVVMLIGRALLVGSRLLIFALFASFFHYWLFVVVGFHYLLMFVLVCYQMCIVEETLIRHIVYSVVTPFVYIFDFCFNWLAGPTFYWYAMCYIPIYFENVLMSSLLLWYASRSVSPAWYIVPFCLCVIVVYPLGAIAQSAYYRYCRVRREGEKRTMTWSYFRNTVIEETAKRDHQELIRHMQLNTADEL